LKKTDPRALRPNLKFGRGILAKKSRAWGDYLLVTMPDAWKSAKDLVAQKPSAIHFVTTMDRIAIEKQAEKLPGLKTIVGLGGGTALDFAKFAGWKRGIDPVLVPAAASVDAGVCASIAVRDKNKVRYIGHSLAKEIICDFALMQTAPKNLNRAGIGDILSIHTALWDWEFAAGQGKAEYNKKFAKATAALVDELEDMAGEIKKVSDQALKWLMQAYARETEVCVLNGSSRPEEGSEHFFAYNVERLTGKSFVHGELVCLGVLLLSRLQENRPERVEKILKQSGVRYQPAQLGLGKKMVEQSLLTLRNFVEKDGLVFSAVNARPIDRRATPALLKKLKFK
jgi:glycerol-1-phosphate dehydrogenase [NAD(P)+]